MENKIIAIPTLHLFQPLDEKLIELLKSLSDEDWNKPTLAKLWTVKDIAAHLLDGNVRFISMLRDKHFGLKAENINSYQDLVDFLNGINADWVNAMKRMSPDLLIELLESTGKQYYEEIQKLDPFEPALFSVAWAGESESQNWFHIAREYTEKWHHQQQIREAVGKQGIMGREFFFPLIDTLMRALPHTYRDVKAENGTMVCILVTGETGGKWSIIKENEGWKFTDASSPTATVEIEPADSWKLLTKGLAKTEAEKRVRITGDQVLGKKALDMVSIMG
ncbi:MAG TPA: maleylpyruvate isomerase N-terminal domain-containing protein [Cyclobacteriaceae bacterium]